MWHGIVLFVNRWNVLNSKAAGLGVIIAAGVSTKIALDMDGGMDADFVLRQATRGSTPNTRARNTTTRCSPTHPGVQAWFFHLACSG